MSQTFLDSVHEIGPGDDVFVVESYVWKENSHAGAKYEYKLFLYAVPQ